MSTETRPSITPESLAQQLAYDHCVRGVERFIASYDVYTGTFPLTSKRTITADTAVVPLRADEAIEVRDKITDHFQSVVLSRFHEARVGRDEIDVMVTYVPREFLTNPEPHRALNVGFLRREGFDPYVLFSTLEWESKKQFVISPEVVVPHLQIEQFKLLTMAAKGDDSPYREIFPENALDIVRRTAARRQYTKRLVV